jgi:hypothetical protein
MRTLGQPVGKYSRAIMENTRRINQLKARVDETVKHRDEGQAEKTRWEQACADFHAQYDSLAFPGGLKGAYERIVNGDSEAMEAAICFLEIRPHFFRSGYMFKDILRKAKRAPLSDDQRARLESVSSAFERYKESRRH